MHTVKLGTRTRQVEASWNELEWPRLRALLPIVYGNYANPIRQRLELLRALLGVPPLFFVKFTAVQLLEISWLTSFLLDEPVALTRQLLPVVRVGLLGRLHGPSERLANLLFIEFVFADSYFVAYCQTQDVAWLDKLVAVLYRPARWPRPRGGDRRRPFAEHRIERDARRVARLPRLVKQAIYTWYLGCRHALADRYPLVFTAGDEPQTQGHPDGWAYVWREVSGGPFGDFDATGRQHAHLVLAKMQDDLQRAADLEAKKPTS